MLQNLLLQICSNWLGGLLKAKTERNPCVFLLGDGFYPSQLAGKKKKVSFAEASVEVGNREVLDTI